MSDRRSITDLTHRLNAIAQNAGKRRLTYAQVAARVRDGAIPAKRDGKEWSIEPEGEARAIELFGLKPDEPQRPAAA